MTLIKCCPNCDNPRIKAPRGDRVQWYCPDCLNMFDQPVEREINKIRKSKAKLTLDERWAFKMERAKARWHSKFGNFSEF